MFHRGESQLRHGFIESIRNMALRPYKLQAIEAHRQFDRVAASNALKLQLQRSHADRHKGEKANECVTKLVSKDTAEGPMAKKPKTEAEGVDGGVLVIMCDWYYNTFAVTLCFFTDHRA